MNAGNPMSCPRYEDMIEAAQYQYKSVPKTGYNVGKVKCEPEMVLGDLGCTDGWRKKGMMGKMRRSEHGAKIEAAQFHSKSVPRAKVEWLESAESMEIRYTDQDRPSSQPVR
jgi:hypothetical protein